MASEEVNVQATKIINITVNFSDYGSLRSNCSVEGVKYFVDKEVGSTVIDNVGSYDESAVYTAKTKLFYKVLEHAVSCRYKL